MNKKVKLVTGICVPAVALGAAAGIIAFAVNQNNKKPIEPVNPEVGDYTVTFNPGEGRITQGKATTKIVAGQTLEQIRQPAVQSDKGMFEGWYDEDGQRVFSVQGITRDTTLTANYVNDVSGMYKTITFAAPTGVKLAGTTSVTVKSGYRFYMVNRPTAYKDNCVFDHWKDQNENTVDENTLISADMTLTPVFIEQVTITFNPNNGSVRRGATTQLALNGVTKFGDINAPEVYHTEKFFKFWGATADATTAIDDTTTFTQDKEVFAIWDTTTSANGTMTAVTGETTAAGCAYTYTGTTSVMYTKSTDLRFNQIYKPHVVPTNDADKGNFVFDYWEVCLNPTAGTKNWQPESELTATAINQDAIEIRPKMKKTVSKVFVNAPETVSEESETQLYAYVIGGGNSSTVAQTVTWNLYDDSTTTTASTNADFAISNNGKLTVNKRAAEAQSQATSIWVEAASTIDTGKKNRVEVKVSKPYVNSDKVWVQNTLTGETGLTWKWVNMDDLTNPDTPTVRLTQMSGSSPTTFTLNKNETSTGTPFNTKMWIGDKINELDSNFLSGCKQFNSEIVLNNVVVIKNNFMENCTAFNQKIDLSKVEYIHDNFMQGCIAFNNGNAAASDTNKLTLSKAVWVGSHFLANCYTTDGSTITGGFNTTVELSTNLLDIGSHFLYNCQNFNKNITIPSSVNTIGNFFMKDCVSFTSKLTLGWTSGTIAQHFGADQHAVSTTASDTALHNTGFVIDGTLANEFIAQFPAIEQATPGIYRRYRQEFDYSFELSPALTTAGTGIKDVETPNSVTLGKKVTQNNTVSIKVNIPSSLSANYKLEDLELRISSGGSNKTTNTPYLTGLTIYHTPNGGNKTKLAVNSGYYIVSSTKIGFINTTPTVLTDIKAGDSIQFCFTVGVGTDGGDWGAWETSNALSYLVRFTTKQIS